MLSRRQLYILVAATLLPVALFAAVILHLKQEDTRRGLEEHLLHNAQILAQSVERMVAQEIAALTVLALAEELDTGDFRTFHIEAQRLVEARPDWHALVLSDGERQLVNTRLPYGADLPPLFAPAEVARIFRTGQPQVSTVNVLPDRYTHPFLAIRIPVTRAGTVRYALAATMPVWIFNTLLRDAGQDIRVPEAPWQGFQGNVAIIDQQDRVIALGDSPDPSDPRLGAPASPALLATARSPSGVAGATLPNGQAVLTAHATAPLTGWRVVLSQPAAVADAALAPTRMLLAGGGLLALALAGLVAAVLVRLLHRLSVFSSERAAEQRIADIAAHIPGLIYRRVVQPNGASRYAGIAGGLKPPAGTPADPLPLDLLPADMEGMDEALRAAAAALTPFCFEREGQAADGGTRWLRCVATPRRTADGGVVWDGVTLDITDLRQAEAALRDSESRLTMAQAAAGIGSWDWDLASGRLWWSDSLYRLLGLEPGALTPDIAAFTDRFIHPDDRPVIMPVAQEAMLHGGEIRLEYRVTRADGALRWLECAGGTVAGPDGRPARLLGILRDITERKATEEALRAANAALEREVVERKRTEALLETLYATAPAGMCVIDSQLRYLRINTRLAAANGLPVEAHIGRRLRDLTPPPAVETIEAQYRQVLATGAPLDDCLVSTPGPAGSGTTRHWLLNLHPLRQPDGTVYAVNAIVQDITERRAMEETLRDALDEAQAANTTKARFFAAASHDLRQPVQTLFLFAHALSERLRDHPALALVTTMQQALEGMKALIDTLLDISRIDSGTLSPEVTDFPAVTLMQRLAADYGPRMAAKGLKFRMVGCPAWIRSDPVLLGRVLGNLLDNALKYTDRGGVVLGCRRRGDHALIEVWDSGAGIAPEDQAAIFDEFVQLASARHSRSQGLGLGLSIVQRLTRLLGHDLTLRSRPGRGSVFSVRVPLVAGETATSRPPPLLVASGSGGPPLAVMVEDDSTILTALGMLLEEWGFETIAAFDAEAALAMIAQRRRRPDLIIADYFLPGSQTGTEAIRRIRAYCNTPVPSIVLTGDNGPDRALEVGRIGSHLVLKPVMPGVLQDLIQRVSGLPRR